MLTDDVPFIASQFGSMFSTACSIAERYAPAFQGVADGTLSVEDANREAEKDVIELVGSLVEAGLINSSVEDGGK